jgi:hypothetical protein
VSGTGPRPCGQDGCDGQFMWARTERRWDSIRGRWSGGTPAPLHWPLPATSVGSDGTVAQDPASGKVPNVGAHRDEHGTWWARVATEGEPIRADEKPAFMHHVFCKNPPSGRRPARAAVKKAGRAAAAPAARQDLLPGLDVPGAGPLSDRELFPGRRSRPGR